MYRVTTQVDLDLGGLCTKIPVLLLYRLTVQLDKLARLTLGCLAVDPIFLPTHIDHPIRS